MIDSQSGTPARDRAPARGFAPADESTRPSIQDLYPEGYSHCYGCGRNNPKGLHIRSFEAGDDLVAHVPPCTDEISHPGVAYSGYISSLLGCHAIAAAAAAAHRAHGRSVGDGEIAPFMTSQIKVEFVEPTPVGVPYELRARALFAHKHKVVVKAELLVNRAVHARAEVEAVEINESGRPASRPRPR